MYVARYSTDPLYDIERGWTAYMEPTSASRETLALKVAELVYGALPYRIQNAFDNDDIDTVVEYILETYDIRYHEKAGLWMWVHNPAGLSCWPLEATSAEEALAEAAEKADRLDWGGFGWVTVGKVTYVGSVSSILHVFACDDVEKENDM